MRVTMDMEGGAVSFVFVPEAGEPLAHFSVRMARLSATVRLPAPIPIHPDLPALAAALICGRFSASVRFAWSVSPGLLAALAQLFETPFEAEGTASERPAPPDGRPGLAFSGGVDSLAAAILLPTAELFHLHRARPADEARTDPRSSEGALATCAAISERVVHVVPTDLEFVRDPIGFPDDLACAVPAILMADARRLDAVAFGTIGEAAYRYGVKAYRGFEARPLARRIQAVFGAVGLPVLNPVAGMSEVMTTTMVAASPWAALARSCQRGELDPCGRCRKCFRKSLTEAAIGGSPITDRRADAFFATPSILTMLLARPVKLENVLAWALARYAGDHALMTALKARIASDDLGWMERYDPAAVEEAPPAYRAALGAALDAHLPPLTDADVVARGRWDAKARSRTDAGRALYREFLRPLIRLGLIERGPDGLWRPSKAPRVKPQP